MFKPVSTFIGLRYIHARQHGGFVSFITFSSFIGIAIGVWALITVLSVMNGFQLEIRDRLLSMTAHATISSAYGSMREWKLIQKQIEQHKEVLATAPYILREGMLILDDNVRGVGIRGIDPLQEVKVSQIKDKIISGTYTALHNTRYGILLGKYLARSLGAMVGSKVTLVIPSLNVTPVAVSPRMKRFTVVGIFEVGHSQYDSQLALIRLVDAQKLFKIKHQVDGIRLKLSNMYQAPQISRNIAQSLPGFYQVIDWTQYHANLFRAIRIEKNMMFVILSLIVAVAAFNIVSTLIIVVNNKKADIAILRTIGASSSQIMRIFIVHGTFIGLIGTLIGVITGVLTATNIETIVPFIEHITGIQFLSADVYLITELPSHMQWRDVGIIALIAFLLSICATLFPAWRAAKVRPAEALRYE